MNCSDPECRASKLLAPRKIHFPFPDMNYQCSWTFTPKSKAFSCDSWTCQTHQTTVIVDGWPTSIPAASHCATHTEKRKAEFVQRMEQDLEYNIDKVLSGANVVEFDGDRL